MSKIASVLKEEITRLARKEVNARTKALRKASGQYRLVQRRTGCGHCGDGTHNAGVRNRRWRADGQCDVGGSGNGWMTTKCRLS